MSTDILMIIIIAATLPLAIGLKHLFDRHDKRNYDFNDQEENGEEVPRNDVII